MTKANKTKKIAYSRALSIVKKYFPNVKKVNDAHAGVKVEVTKRDEVNSKRKAHEGCAMAVACKRAMKLDGVIISMKVAYLIKNNVATRFQVPEHLAREVVSFDRGANFEPGEYKLTKPDYKIGEGSNHGSSSGHPGGHSNPQHRVLTKNIRTVLGSDTER